MGLLRSESARDRQTAERRPKISDGFHRQRPPSSQDAFRAAWRHSRGDRRPPVWVLRGLQVGSILVIGGECLVGVWGLTVKHQEPVVAVASSVADRPDPRAGVEPAPSIASAAAARPLFSAPRPASGSAPMLSEQAHAWTTRLTIRGVMTGTIAQAVIEDTQTQKTYLVTVGQRVLEGLVVEEIRDNRVVLSWQGEHVELSL